MSRYALEYADGRVSEIVADNDTEAELAALARFDDAIIADQWDADGWNCEDEPMKRILIWDSEESAYNDAGANAIAALTTVGTA